MITGRCDCGVQYAVKRGGSAVGYCALSIRCGTRSEAGYSGGKRDTDGFHSGIAHFTEHAVFKGTGKRNAAAVSSCLDKLGGELNAYTTKEEIVLHATVLKEDLRKAASLLFELVTSPSFPEQEIETERGVIIDEINSYKDSPSEEVYDKFEEMLFEGHPLSGPILGTVSSVRKITREELLRFVHDKFIPVNMAFTVVADLPEEKLEKSVKRLVSEYFASAASCHQESNGIISRPAPFRQALGFDVTKNKRNHQVNCVLGTAAPSLYDGDRRIAAVLLSNLLGGPASNSILNSVLREKNGWVYGVECSYTQYSDTGIMAICLGCEKDNLDKCLKAIWKELEKLKKEPISERRLKSAKKQLLGQLAISGDNGETQCLSMGKSLLAYGTVVSPEESRRMVESVTAARLQDLSCELFDRASMSMLTFI